MGQKVNPSGLRLGINRTWDSRWYSDEKYSEFLENDIRIVKDQMPKLVIDVNIVDSRVEKVSSFLVIFSLYNYSISEPNYYQSMADTLITKRLMTSKVFSHEVMGQTSTQNLYRDVEKSINKLISIYLDQWFRDNPLKQF